MSQQSSMFHFPSSIGPPIPRSAHFHGSPPLHGIDAGRDDSAEHRAFLFRRTDSFRFKPTRLSDHPHPDHTLVESPQHHLQLMHEVSVAFWTERFRIMWGRCGAAAKTL